MYVTTIVSEVPLSASVLVSVPKLNEADDPLVPTAALLKTPANPPFTEVETLEDAEIESRLRIAKPLGSVSTRVAPGVVPCEITIDT